jgi:hypothetical protein
MNALRDVLVAAGVWDWLRAQFPDMSDDELIAEMDGDFAGIIEDLLEKGTAPGEAAAGGR